MAASTQFYSSENLHIEFWRSMAVVDWRGDVGLEQTRVLGRAYETLANAHPHGIVALCTVRAGVPVLSPDARAESIRFIKKLGSSLLSLISVIEDEGMYAEVMRSAIRGVNVMAQTPKIVSVPTVEEGMRTALPLVPRTSPGDDLSGELRSVVAAIRGRRPSLSPAGPNAAR